MLSEDSVLKRYKKVFVACDHAGVDMKRHLMGRFPFVPWVDLGTNSSESVDYPDFADKLAAELKPELKDACGVLICGSGQGMAIRANRHKHIRAALCWSDEVAILARQHNDANVLCLAGRLTVFAIAERILSKFLTTEFENGRHQARIDKLGL